MRLALVQITSTTSIKRNIALVDPLIRKAAAGGAALISLPEVVNLAQMDRQESRRTACHEETDPFLAHCQELARALDVWLHLGSLVIRLPHESRMANRAYMIDETGKIRARYDKIHMFDVDLAGGESYRESSLFRPGTEAVLVDSPWGPIGLVICYDLRFAQLHRELARKGAGLILNPAAFTRKTGQAHWHSLLTSRAIENGCFIAAAAQTGDHEDGRKTYGHSLVVAPWGNILIDAGEETGICFADLDFAEVTRARRMIPALQHDRSFKIKSYSSAD